VESGPRIQQGSIGRVQVLFDLFEIVLEDAADTLADGLQLPLAAHLRVGVEVTTLAFAIGHHFAVEVALACGPVQRWVIEQLAIEN